TMGWPFSMAYRARTSLPAWPAHVTTSRSCSTAALRPWVVLYCDRSQFSESASNTGERVEFDEDSTSAVASAAVAQPAERIEAFKFISGLHKLNCIEGSRGTQNTKRTPRRAIRAGMTLLVYPNDGPVTKVAAVGVAAFNTLKTSTSMLSRPRPSLSSLLPRRFRMFCAESL